MLFSLTLILFFEEWGDHSIFLTPQRDRDWVEKMYGKYQAGLIGFKNDLYGLKKCKMVEK